MAGSHRAPDRADSLPISAIAASSSEPGRHSTTPSATARSQMSRPLSVRMIVSVQPVALAEPAERDVGVLGGEIRALEASRPGELVRLLERVRELLAVLRVEEQLALHVHADEVVELEAEPLLRDLDHEPVVREGLRAQQAERPGDLPRPLVHPPSRERPVTLAWHDIPTSATFDSPISAALMSASGFAEYV